MKRRVLPLFLALVLMFSMLSLGASAADNSDVIYFEDGSYLVVSIEESLARASNTKIGTKTLGYYDSSDNLEWEANLQGTFSYDGSTASCILASCALDINDTDSWYKKSLSTSWSGATATTELVMAERFLGVTVATYPYTITLTCDKNGNLT